MLHSMLAVSAKVQHVMARREAYEAALGPKAETAGVRKQLQ